MATLEQKIDAERKMRDLLEQQGLPAPDEVEYGHTCIRLLWLEQKRMVVVQIDEPPPGWTYAEDLTNEERERVERGAMLAGEEDLDW